MPQELFININEIDINDIEIDREGIRAVNPHRYEMEQLNGIIKFDPENKIIIGFKEVKDDEFWVRGHIPGRPLFPGVLMMEAAAQLCTYYYKRVIEDDRFLGFGGIDKVKFRGKVIPGDRFIIVAEK